MACDLNETAAAARCFACYSEKELLAMIAYLICTNGGGGAAGGQIKVYTSDPNTEVVVPDDPAQPAVAYSSDGSGAILGWNVGSQLWV